MARALSPYRMGRSRLREYVVCFAWFVISAAAGHASAAADITITNGSPFYVRVVVYDVEAATLAPGDAAYDTLFGEPLNPHVPVLALAYRDANLREYIGAAGRVFYSPSGSKVSLSWLVQISEIRTPFGQTLVPGVYPLPPAIPSARQIPFPRETWHAVAGVQIVNNTLFTASVRVNGQQVAVLPPGGYHYVSNRQLLPDSRQGMIQLVFTDRGLFVGGTEYPFYVPSQGISAYQFVVGPYDIRR